MHIHGIHILCIIFILTGARECNQMYKTLVSSITPSLSSRCSRRALGVFENSTSTLYTTANLEYGIYINMYCLTYFAAVYESLLKYERVCQWSQSQIANGPCTTKVRGQNTFFFNIFFSVKY